MKKRLLLILVVGIAFSPTVYADQVGPYNKARDFETPGASKCGAGMHAKQLAEAGSEGIKGEKSDSQAGAAY